MSIYKLECGCIMEVNESQSKSTVAIEYNITNPDYTRIKCVSDNDSCKNTVYKKEQLYKAEQIKIEEYKNKLYTEFINSINTIIDEEIVPVKYIANKIASLDKYYRHHSLTVLSSDLFKIQKIKNRYYCSKKIVDKFFDLKLYSYYSIGKWKN